MRGNKSSVTIRVLPSGAFQIRYRLKTREQVTDGSYSSRDEAELRKKEIEVDLERGIQWDDRKSKLKFAIFIDRVYGVPADQG